MSSATQEIVEGTIKKIQEAKTREESKKLVKSLVGKLKEEQNRLAPQSLATILTYLTPKNDPSIVRVQAGWEETHFQHEQLKDRVEVLQFLDEQTVLPTRMTASEFTEILSLFNEPSQSEQKQILIFEKLYPLCHPAFTFQNAVDLIHQIRENTVVHSQLVRSLVWRTSPGSQTVLDNDKLQPSQMIFFLEYVHLEFHVVLQMPLKLGKPLGFDDLKKILTLLKKRDQYAFPSFMNTACDEKKIEAMMSSEWQTLGSPQQIMEWKQRLAGTYQNPLTQQLKDSDSLLHRIFDQVHVETTQQPTGSLASETKQMSPCERCQKPAVVRHEPCMHLTCRECMMGAFCPSCRKPVESRTVPPVCLLDTGTQLRLVLLPESIKGAVIL